MDTYRIFRDGQLFEDVYDGSERVEMEEGTALTVAAVISVLHPQERVIVYTQYGEIAGRFLAGSQY